jgi:hypothetical protein
MSAEWTEAANKMVIRTIRLVMRSMKLASI